MVMAASPAGEASTQITRGGPNVWWLAFANGPVEPATFDGSLSAMPSALLRQTDAAVTLAKIELDSCGTWITLANNEVARPVVVRRAGWVDVRGHELDGPLLDDRVGLGPGDCLVLSRSATTDDALDALLAEPCEPAALAAAAGGEVVVLGVPGDLGEDPRLRVVEATGIALDDLELPGYPLGDLQPELWREAPRPPRVARLRLPDHRKLRDVRNLLDRLFASWRLGERVDEGSVKLAASELATNAVMHSNAPESVTVRFLGHAVRIEVDDHSDESVVMREADDGVIGGRGLHVVDAVASKWGVEPKLVGKSVWFEVDVEPHQSQSAAHP